jgi:putative intracellular protease/amidase
MSANRLEATLRPDQVNADDYVAIYYAGGHGTMWDFPGNETLARLAARIYEQGKVVAAVCHGVTGLFDIWLSDQRYLIDGRQVTGFANIEETMMGLTSKVPFLTESRLKERGGKYHRGLPFMSHVVVSDRLVTGQNPRSTKAVARKVIELLTARPA